MKVTQEQVEIGEAISRIVMAWIAFSATLLATAFFLGFLVWCIVKHENASAQIVVGVIDSFLLILLQIIFKSIFSQKTPQPETASNTSD